jgi:hypothetical protein
MPIQVRVTQIDLDGYCGREPHPPAALAGETGLIISCGLDPDDDQPTFIYQVCIDGTFGEVFELVEHEFEVIGLDSSALPMQIAAAAVRCNPSRFAADPE